MCWIKKCGDGKKDKEKRKCLFLFFTLSDDLFHPQYLFFLIARLGLAFVSVGWAASLDRDKGPGCNRIV